MRLSNQFFVLRGVAFLLLLIFSSSDIAKANAQIDAINPCISGETELDSMGISGIWRGSFGFISSNLTATGQTFEFRLSQDNARILGKGVTEQLGGVATFNVEGFFDGKSLRVKSRDFQLVKRYTGNYSDDIFNRFQLFDFQLNFIKNSILDGGYLIENQLYRFNYEVDIIKGTVDSPDGSFSQGEGYLTRNTETIIVMFGGCRDGENRSLIDGVYKKYLENQLKPNLKYGQYAKYFAYNRIEEAKLFVYRLLKVSPQARVALVGHSLGGDATFRLAQKLAEELPELKIDLVITLDPVTLKKNSSKPRLGEPVPPDNSRASIPSQPNNITKWINVHVGTWTSKENFLVRTGGIQWKAQPNAINIVANTVHADAYNMFFLTKEAQLENMSPADILLQLEGLSNRIGYQKMAVKLSVLNPLPN